MIQRVSNRTNFETHLEENIKRHLGHIPQPTFAATEIATRPCQCQGTGLRNRVSCACRLACVGRLPVGIGRPVWLHGLGRSKFRGFWDQRGEKEHALVYDWYLYPDYRWTGARWQARDHSAAAQMAADGRFCGRLSSSVEQLLQR